VLDRPQRHCVRWDPAPLPQKGAEPPISAHIYFGLDGWMDQDATGQGGRSRPRPHCARWGPRSPSPKGHSPQFSSDICCGHMAGWIKMLLGREVGLRPGNIVLDVDPAPLSKRGRSPQFSAHICCAKWLDASRCHLLARPRPHCARWGPSSPSPKGHSPQFSADICCGHMAGWIKMLLGREVGLSPGNIVLDGDPAPPPQRGTAPNFRPISVVATWLDGSTCYLVGK